MRKRIDIRKRLLSISEGSGSVDAEGILKL